MMRDRLERLVRLAREAGDRDAGLRTVVYMPAKDDGSGPAPGVYHHAGYTLVISDPAVPGTAPGQRDYRHPA